MNELLAVIAAGALIPAISLIVKKLIVDRIFEGRESEISIRGKDGKEFKLLLDSGASSEELRDIFESEIEFEAEVKKNLERFIRSHEKYDLKLSNGKQVDFLLFSNGRRIGIEAKSNADRFKAKWISSYFKESSGIDELIMILDSKIPENFLNEVKTYDKNMKVKFISSPRGKELSKSIGNVLETELGLNKSLHRTSR
jgi:cell fate (sporulation/competence/biofilm development) regulator YlbF (YheA/YmcA/DUF963 family)